MSFKLFLILMSLGNPVTYDIRPPIELNSMDACVELKEFYEKQIPANRLKAVCLDDREAADEDEDDKSAAKK